MADPLSSLPAARIDKLTEALQRFLRIQAAGGVVLLLCAIIAVTAANTALVSTTYADFWETDIGFTFGSWTSARAFKAWINDGLLTLFFFLVALELKRELVLGELRNPRLAALSFAAALGGMAFPAALFVLFVGDGPGAEGWGVVMATDTAFVVGGLALLGSRIPSSLRLFLLTLAVFDDVGAILVVAIGYSAALDWGALSLALAGVLVLLLLAGIGARALPLFFLCGGAIWLAIDASGIHATVTGVIVGLLTPARGWVSDARLRAIFGRAMAHPRGETWSGDTTQRADLRRAGAAAAEVLSPIERIEMMLNPWVAFAILPLFALANAGVAIDVAQIDASVAVGIVAGLVVGKPVGIFAMSWLAVRAGLALKPIDLTWPLVAAGGLLSGVGFTMSLFIAELAFENVLLASAKVGILAASVLAGVGGTMLLAALSRRRTPDDAPHAAP